MLSSFLLNNMFNLFNIIVFQSLPSEIEVKYKIAECYTILKLDKDAIAVLDGIPSRQRTPKVGYYFSLMHTVTCSCCTLHYGFALLIFDYTTSSQDCYDTHLKYK